jgi:4'-phosphopantetheinyl transferase EntD
VAGLIGRLVPDTVATAESVGPLPDPGPPPHPEEAELVAAATARRRAEFAAARDCGRKALARLGFAPVAIPRLPGGGPKWPDGVAGSITHCAGYRAAVAGWTSAVATIGIDAEPDEPLRDGLLELVALPRERARLAALRQIRSGVHWDRILFSAKESVYKAWFPVAGSWLDFAGAELSFDPGAERFTARPRVPVPPAAATLATMSGRWLVADGLVVTAVVVAAP